MSDGYHRKHESGSEKRKKKDEKEEALKKMKGSILKYINNDDKPNNDTTVTTNVSISEILQNKTPKQSETDVINEKTEQIYHSRDKQFQFDDPDPELASSEDLKMRQSNECRFSGDPAEWEVNADLIGYYAENVPSQNLKSDFLLMGRQFGDKIRYARKEYFLRKLTNGEVVRRDWLIYSPSTGKVFCYVCKLFGCKYGDVDDESGNGIGNQFQTGFDDWKNAIARITLHEKSKDHIAAISMMLLRQKSTRIDAELNKEKEKLFKYWTEVLKRIIAVIKFLAERGLAFRGESELHNCHNNGNYLGCIDLLAEFDPFLMEHIRKHGNPGKGNVSYMSSTICDEFIDILGSKVLTQIISEINNAKYYGISIDSTPDISHMDQLTLVIRYVIPNGNVVERFLQFIPIEHHDGKYLFDLVVNTLKLHGIDIKNCRSQSYDNTSNMSGIYSGVQARFKEINSLAEWIPCAAHSLNLVGSSAVQCCSAAVNYFGIVQSVYNLFSASPQRWLKFKERIKDKANASVLQSLSETRWSARSDATKAFYANYLEIRLALSDITESERQPPAAVHEAKSLIKNLDHYETALMCVIWKDLLQQIDIANKALQQSGIDLCTIIKLYDSLTKHFHETRNNFKAFESMAKSLTKSDYKECTKRKHVRKRFHDEVMEVEEDNIDTSSNLNASDNFRIQSFYVIIDRLIIEMEKRRAAYAGLHYRFSFLLDRSLSSDEIVSKANELIKIYSSDLEEAFADEFLLFSRLFVDTKSVAEMLKAQIENKLVTSFPNVNIAFRIYLSIFGTSCEGERSFSKLKLIKNYLRSTMGQERLSSLALLSIENDLMRKMSFEDVICDFARAKSRKVYII